MKKLALIVALFACLFILMLGTASAALEGQIFSTGGTFTITIQDSSATYVNHIEWNAGPGIVDTGLTNKTTTGTTATFGPVPVGSEIIFSIYVQDTGDRFFTGPASRNPDNFPHANVTETAGVYTVAFEDLFGGGDQDYFDAVFLVEFNPLPVNIDVKPGSFPNSINPNAGGVIPVAILTTDDFDASTVDPETVALGGVSARSKGKSGKYGSLEDVDGDGDYDLVVQVLNEINWDGHATEVKLTGFTWDGYLIEGTDSVNLVPPN